VVEALECNVKELSASERAQVFGGTAEETYRLSSVM
jgi:hypothetical protein